MNPRITEKQKTENSSLEPGLEKTSYQNIVLITA